MESSTIGTQKKRLAVLASIFLALTFSGCEFKPIELNRVEDIRIESIKGAEIKGIIVLSIHNPYSFPVTVMGANFKIFKAENQLGTASINEGFRIAANSSETYPVKLNANVESLLSGGIMGILNMLGGKNPRVKLIGEIKARALLIPRTIPIELETELPLSGLNL